MAVDSIKTTKKEIFTNILSDINSSLTLNDQRIEQYGKVTTLLIRLNVTTDIPNWTPLFTLRSDMAPSNIVLLMGTKGGTPYFISLTSNGECRNYGQFPIGDYYTFFVTYIV